METHPIEVNVNGNRIAADVEPRLLLVYFLREQAGLTGTHIGCDTNNTSGCLITIATSIFGQVVSLNQHQGGAFSDNVALHTNCTASPSSIDQATTITGQPRRQLVRKHGSSMVRSNGGFAFCVLRGKVRGHRDVVTVGHTATFAAGEWIAASGEWVNDRTVVDATLLGHASILFDVAIRPARAVGWRIRGGRRLRRNRSGRIFGRDWRFLPLLSLGRGPNRMKICMHWVGDKPRRCKERFRFLGTHRDSLRLIALVRERRRKFRHIERELTRRATALP
jgi:hypothetical protein